MGALLSVTRIFGGAAVNAFPIKENAQTSGMVTTGAIFVGVVVALWAFYYVMVWLLNVSSLSETGFVLGLYIR